MNCEFCSKEHNGSFASGRFCSRVCAITFVSRQNREEKNQKASASLSGHRIWRCSKCKYVFSTQRLLYLHRRVHKGQLEYYKGDGSRRKCLIRENGHLCWVCKLSEWMNKPIPLELDHIDGNPENNERSNLRVICPNCHAQTDTYKGRNMGKVQNSKRALKLKKYGGYR